jgi:peptidoglycan/xylan/chitin deacetylase (PgdA/CDA1 family)
MPARFVRLAKRIAKRILGPLIFGRSILIYHRIAKADFDPWNLAVMPDEFERQLAGMRSKTVLPLQEFAKLHVQRKLPRNAIAITFDDGYACNALVAAPILESFGYPATFFIVSDAIRRPEEFWWDQFEFIFHAPGFDYETAVRLLASRLVNGLGAPRRQHSGPPAAFLALWELLRHLSTQERRRYLDDLRGHMGLKQVMRPTHRPMIAAELRALATNPEFEIGGHTASHPSLPDLNPAEQEQEIILGAQFLEATIGKPIRTFSYPFGDRGQVTPQIVMAAGFECAVTANHRRLRSGDNRFELPRRQAVNQNARTY